MRVRRVVTAEAVDGRAVIAEDRVIDALVSPSGNEILHLWGADETPDVGGSAAADESALAPIPGPGGFRCAVFCVAPGARLSGSHAPGMHRTDTVDVIFVLEGEVVLRLDGGGETLLRSGDALVQGGARHEWANRTSGPAVLGVFTVGADRTDSR